MLEWVSDPETQSGLRGGLGAPCGAGCASRRPPPCVHRTQGSMPDVVPNLAGLGVAMGPAHRGRDRVCVSGWGHPGQGPGRASRGNRAPDSTWELARGAVVGRAGGGRARQREQRVQRAGVSVRKSKTRRRACGGVRGPACARPGQRGWKAEKALGHTGATLGVHRDTAPPTWLCPNSLYGLATSLFLRASVSPPELRRGGVRWPSGPFLCVGPGEIPARSPGGR